ncbi:MAG TPA: Ig-like domain-containing protein [Longimicrobiales bacterium]
MRARRALFVFSIFFLSACGSDDPSGPPRIDEVRITTAAGASDIEVQRGGSVQLQARALRDGSVVSGIQFQWRSEAPAIASVDANGLLRGLEYGDAVIVADLVGAEGPSGRATARVVGQAVARIDFSPESAWVDVGDTLTLTALPRDAAGVVLQGVELTWRTTSANLAVDAATGRMEGLAPGPAEVEAEAWNGVKGSARVRVTPVTGFAPDSGRYGAVMTIQGAGLPADIAAVEFTAASGGGRVPAFVRSASATDIEVWVPAEAGTGPIRLVGEADSFPTSRAFEVTADDDIFEGADCGADQCAYIVSVPFHNPSLLAASSDQDLFTFELAQPSPISVYLVDRGARNGTEFMAAFVIRVEPFSVPTLMYAVDFVEGVYRDSVVYAHANLAPGRYVIQVFATGGNAPPRRAYGLTITTTADFRIPPDALEPNDSPLDAGSPVTLPFDRADLAAENPWSVDNHVFDVAVPSDITATLTGAGGDLDLLLIAGDSVDWSGVVGASPHPAIIEVGFTPGSSSETIQASVPAGRYNVVVQEFGGQATTYRLQITATAASPASPFTLAAPAAPAGAARRLAVFPPALPHRLAPRVAR